MSFLRSSGLVLAFLTGAAAVVGCGGESTRDASSSGGAAGGGGASSCGALKDAIAAQVAGGGACTATVRFGYETYEPLGFQILCHPYAKTDIDQAAATATADTKMHFNVSLTEKAPKDYFVFYRAPIDFGGVAAVSARSGLTVFGGGIVWDGPGDILYPTSFRPAAELGPECASKKVAVSARGFDLQNEASLDPAKVDAAMAAVEKSALLESMARETYLFDAMVLLYPETVGLFDPKSAEWIVLVDSGYLE